MKERRKYFQKTMGLYLKERVIFKGGVCLKRKKGDFLKEESI